MSGGSYDYLYSRGLEWYALDSDHLERMINRLAGLGYAEDAAREARELQLLVRQSRVRIEAIQRRMEGVFRAIEWWDSCDTNEDDFKEALKKYRGGP